MNTNIARSFARCIALPAISAGVIGGAALGLAGVANAASTQPTGPGYSYSPGTKAKPAPEAKPGARWHKGIYHLPELQPTAVR